MSTHTISVRLENRPGALARVSQLFSRRGYNIQSLAVGPTESPDISRLTLRVDCSEHSLEQIEKQMHKLVNVLRVTELRPEDVDAFEELLRPHGIRELARTGRIGLHRPHTNNHNGNNNGKDPNG